MTTKEIRKALKEGKKVIFNRHIWGAPHGFERLPLNAVREVQGITYVHIHYVYRHSCKPTWAMVDRSMDDYVSID